MAANAEQTFLPISEVSSFVQRWTLRARVTIKSQMRTFSKNGSNGKVFSVNILDSYGGEIRASFFTEVADKYFDMLQVGKCYTFSRGNVRIANQQFNQCKHKYEISFDRVAEIIEVDDDKQIEAFKISVTDIKSLMSKEVPCNVDLCGVITQASSAISFKSKEGKDLVKREITIADDTASSITVTLWGDRAKQDDALFEAGTVACLKGVIVKEWNGGRSGSLLEGGHLVFKAAIPEAAKVQQWWSQGGKAQSLNPLSKAGGGGGGGSMRNANAKPMDLTQVRRVAEQVLQQPETYSVYCRLALVQMQKKGEPQPLLYNACQELKEGKLGPLPCNKRVDGGGFCASCNRAGKVAPRYNLRCLFSDSGDKAWLTTFHEAAEQVLGLPAEEAQALERGEGGREALESVVIGKYFNQPLQLVLRAKLDTYNGESRTNVTCVDARPVSCGERGRGLLQEIRAMLSAEGGAVGGA